MPRRNSQKPRANVSSQHPQPRRVSPERSVTLQNHHIAVQVSPPAQNGKGHIARKLSASGSGSGKSDESPVNSMGESHETTQSDPKTWFDQSNENPTATYSNAMDVDPPFFQKESESSNEDRSLLHPGRGSAARLATAQSSSADDYRSVIDDLTVEIQNLKEQLKHYKQQGPDLLRKDKLFEIKFHGLPSRKKRELEATLREFAAGLEESPEPSSSRQKVSSRRANALSGSGSGSGSKMATSSSGSRNRPVDSAYASMSTGNTSSGPSLGRHMSRSRAKANDQKVENYLRDIPEGLYPKHMVLTDRDRKRFVVRRLEQLFTGKVNGARNKGKQAAPVSDNSKGALFDIPIINDTKPQQPNARANQSKPGAQTTSGQTKPSALPGTGGPEASREARILPRQTQGNKQSRSRDNGSSNSNGDRTESGGVNPTGNSHGLEASSGSGSGNGSGQNSSPSSEELPEQRPTRPNDLDPDRVQIPSENMAYIQHLGLTAPELVPGQPADVDDVAPDAEGWVYLNLLCNLAQLHMINVTPSFVRKAVTELSTKFQLSPDGRKIRWRGGSEGTKLSSDTSGDSSQSPGTDNNEDATRPTKRKKQNSGLRTGDSRSSSKKLVSASSESFHYKPMFARKGSSRSGTSMDDTLSSFGPVDESNAADSKYDPSGSGATTSRKKRRLDGAIIYYSGAPFCTDLSGDPGDASPTTYMMSTGRETTDRTTDNGESTHVPELFRSASGSSLNYRPLATPAPPWSVAQEMDVDDDGSISAGDESDFDLSWTDKQQYLEVRPLEPSGLGGVLPDDHFMVFVTTRRPTDGYKTRNRSRLQSEDATDGMIARLAVMSTSSPRSAHTPLPKDTKSLQIEYMSGRIKRLAPVPLPPPAMFIPPFSSDASSGAIDYFEDDCEDEGFVSSTSDEYMSRQANPHHSDGYPDGVDLSSGDEDGDAPEDDTGEGMYDQDREDILRRVNAPHRDERPSLGSAVAAPGSARRSKSVSLEPVVLGGGSSAATAGKAESDDDMSSSGSED
ncbi:hypothetical protein VHEMI06113 [[Torrubiella] hemipterigena]|uniref:Frequency clock protein n=1 Tax=[Torrubiella] hemipterigena TaxID=1531966 RepID=A0A0A1TKC8_9HYPO|nr:hypothetical protein VHEMI06113 [[Torrubiella] hemipterigena]